jgi:hypothetical protein
VTQARLLGISRRSLYYQPTPPPPPPEEVAIKHRIDELYTAHPFYGSRKLTVLLSEQFGPINRKRVQRYMREMGIAGIAPGPNLSKHLSDHRVYPYLLRGVNAQHPNHIWGCDITYIRLRHGWLYLVAQSTGFLATLSAGHSMIRSRSLLYWMCLQRRCRLPSPRYGTPTRGAISPARKSRNRFWPLGSRSVWMAKGEQPTTSSLSVFGARSNMRRSIWLTTAAHARPGKGLHAISHSTTVSGHTRLSNTADLVNSILDRGNTHIACLFVAWTGLSYLAHINTDCQAF